MQSILFGGVAEASMAATKVSADPASLPRAGKLVARDGCAAHAPSFHRYWFLSSDMMDVDPSTVKLYSMRIGKVLWRAAQTASQHWPSLFQLSGLAGFTFIRFRWLWIWRSPTQRQYHARHVAPDPKEALQAECGQA